MMNINTLEKEKAPNEIDLINRYTRRELNEDEVYIFSVTLCDNEVDRDFECFTVQSLEKLAVLFEGRTGIFDHNMKSSGQSARIFKTWTQTVPERKTTYGAPYTKLCARAYMVRTQENSALIEEIEGGIKKEVSVGFSAAKTVCSVCGQDMKTLSCEHIKGQTYAKKLCYGIITDPTDAYEWSFVAVPAQREAGITKGLKKSFDNESMRNFAKTFHQESHFDDAQYKELCAYIDALEKDREEALFLKKQLSDEVKRLFGIVMPGIKMHDLTPSSENMSAERLKQLKDELESRAAQIIPPLVQLAPEKQSKTQDNTAFKI